MRVTDGAAVLVNFTLALNQLREWSASNDFSLADNIGSTKYLSNDDLQNALIELVDSYPTIASIDTKHLNRQGKAIAILHLSGSGLQSVPQEGSNKPHILLMGGLNGDDPVGTEMLIRYARHLITGKIAGVY